MYLRRFADARQQLTMVSRDSLDVRVPVTVNNACNESGFYEVPAKDLVEAPDDYDPEIFEHKLADVEGAANTAIQAMLGGEFPPSDSDRTHLSLFLALQFTRGWTFRKDFDDMVALSSPLWLRSVATPDRVETWLRKAGKPSDAKAVRDFIARATGPQAPRLVPRQGNYIQHMFEQALDPLLPSIYIRKWRLLDFGEPSLLTSDEPIAFVRPPGGGIGPVLADALWFPLDRTHALAMTRTGSEQVVKSGSTRARMINAIVATQAHRWILHHPDDSPLDGLDLGPRIELVEEILDVQRNDTDVRELRRYVKRPVSPTEAPEERP